jgi:hypothetical protein
MSARSLLVSSFIAATAALVLSARPAAAERPNAAFAGKILFSEKRFPTQARSLAAFNAQVRKQSKTNFLEDKEKQTWKVFFAGFLKTPLNDLEYVIKIYELSGRSQQLLVTFEQFTTERGQAALISNMLLERKMVGVNKELLVTMENKGRVLCAGRLKILGQGERFTGKVNFSEEDAQGKEEEE